MYFRNDDKDKTGASMTHTMFDDKQVSTFVGQWNCFPGPNRCIQLILRSPNLSETCATIPSHHFSSKVHATKLPICNVLSSIWTLERLIVLAMIHSESVGGDACKLVLYTKSLPSGCGTNLCG